MKKAYITIAGIHHHLGNEKIEKGQRLRLVKEHDNDYDSEAIRAEMRGYGKIGYVANSVATVRGETMSAGRLYDCIDETAFAKVVFSGEAFAICEVEAKSLRYIPKAWEEEDDPWDESSEEA